MRRVAVPLLKLKPRLPACRFWKGLLAVWIGGAVGQALAFLLARCVGSRPSLAEAPCAWAPSPSRLRSAERNGATCLGQRPAGQPVGRGLPPNLHCPLLWAAAGRMAS